MRHSIANFDERLHADSRVSRGIDEVDVIMLFEILIGRAQLKLKLADGVKKIAHVGLEVESSENVHMVVVCRSKKHALIKTLVFVVLFGVG